MHQKAS